jgi:hypothetical protein
MAAPRVGPHDERHAEPFGVLADPQVLGEVTFLARRADVERVAHRVRAQPDGLFDHGVHRRDRVGRGRDVGLAVELEHQRHFAGVLREELPGQADLQSDAVESALDGELDNVPGVFLSPSMSVPR